MTTYSVNVLDKNGGTVSHDFFRTWGEAWDWFALRLDHGIVTRWDNEVAIFDNTTGDKLATNK